MTNSQQKVCKMGIQPLLDKIREKDTCIEELENYISSLEQSNRSFIQVNQELRERLEGSQEWATPNRHLQALTLKA